MNLMTISGWLLASWLLSLPAQGQTPADTVLANRYYQTADSLSEQGKYQEANRLFRQAQQIYQDSKQWEKYAACLNSIAYNLWPVAAYDSATATAQQALELSEEYLGKEHPEAARAYDVLGIVQEYKGQLPKALSYYERALKIRKKHFYKNKSLIADSYENLGIAYNLMGNFAKSLSYHRKVLDIRLAVEPNNLLSLADVYNNLGAVCQDIGSYDRAMNYFQKSVSKYTKVLGEVSSSVATGYNNLGIVYEMKGDFDYALAHYWKTLSIKRQLFGDIHPDVAKSYSNLGIAYMKKGDYKQAMAYHHEALAIRSKVFDEFHPEVSETYNNLGLVFFKKKDYDQSLDFYLKSVTINRRLLGETSHSLAANYSNIGAVHEEEGDYDQAISYYKKAIAVGRRLNNEANIQIATHYNNLGKVHAKKGAYGQALNNLQESMIANGMTFRDTSVYSNATLEGYLDGYQAFRSLKDKAEVLAIMGMDSISYVTYLLADSLLDKLRYSYQRGDDGSDLNSRIDNFYENALQAGWQAYQSTLDPYYYRSLFYLNERSKSNLLINAMSVLEAKHLGRVPDSILIRESALRSERSFYHSQLSQGQDSSYVNNKLFAINQQYKALMQKLETNYPRYYQLKYADRTTTIKSIQSNLLPDEAVISYSINDSIWFAFTITHEEYRITLLPLDTLLDQNIQRIRYKAHLRKPSTNYLQAASILYKQLVAPVVDDPIMTDIDRLIIIPDGLLGYLPFDLLLTQLASDSISYRTLPYLMRDYTIRYGYSATWLFHPFTRPNRSVQDQYIAFAPSYSTQADSAQQLALGRFRNQVAPLGFNKREANNIRQHLSGVSLTDESAVERRFKAEVGDYRIVHLAMHALVDDQQPMYSRLVFSPDATDTVEDGYLHAYELYDMEIPADLAVLSACETGYGKLEQGEGIISLARAFAYAGCPSIVMSHWTVDDAASAQLMDSFYRYLSEGMRKDEALRQAKLTYLENASVQDTNPFFWGNFVVIGDASPIVNPRSLGWYWWLAGGGVLLLGLVIFLVRSRTKP